VKARIEALKLKVSTYSLSKTDDVMRDLSPGENIYFGSDTLAVGVCLIAAINGVLVKPEKSKKKRFMK